MKGFLYITLFLLSFAQFSFAQTNKLDYANKKYNEMAYSIAAERFENSISKRVDSLTVADRIADSYFKINKIDKSTEWYRFIERNNRLSQDQLLRLSLLERQSNNYKKSEDLLKVYEQKYGPIDVSKTILENSEKLEPLKIDNGMFSPFTLVVNTDASEIGLSYLAKNEALVISSARRAMTFKITHDWTGDNFYSIFRAPIQPDGQLGKLKEIKGKVETKFHDGPAVYDSISGFFYFTRNNYINHKKSKDDSGVVRLKIYRAELVNNKFINVTPMSFSNDDYSCAHPALAKNGKLMYFSSDKPGGFGGMDLYRVELNEKGEAGIPVNLGREINSTQHDAFPSYNSSEDLLFFASDGHLGLGGLDIFVAKLDENGGLNELQNLGAPLNSNVDDFSFVNNEEQTKGYFASNRNGGQGQDDIYGFIQNKKIKNSNFVTGNVSDLLTKLEIKDALLYLKDKNGEIIDSTRSNNDGSYKFNLGDLNDDFSISAQKIGYEEEVKKIIYDSNKRNYKEDLALNTRGYIFDGLVTDNLSDKPISNVSIKVVDNITGEIFENLLTINDGTFTTSSIPYKFRDPIKYSFILEAPNYLSKTVVYEDILADEKNLNVNAKLNLKLSKIGTGDDLNNFVDINPIYFDLNSSYIRKDAAIELDKIVKIMKENPSMKIELGSHTDTRESDQYNIWLSDRRAKSSANYIVSKGVSEDRITGQGYGETKLVVTDAEIEQASNVEEKEILHQKNRRTEFIVK